jgi:DNA anti-recombination protein RmuC
MIGNLTNDMMRLCGEIAALRETRADLRSNLAQSRDELREAVSQKRAEFQDSRKEMANKTRSDLDEFVGRIKDAVTELKQSVAVFQEQILGDLAGARRAWCGSGSMPAPPRAEEEEAPKDIAPRAKKKKR